MKNETTTATVSGGDSIHWLCWRVVVVVSAGIGRVELAFSCMVGLMDELLLHHQRERVFQESS